MRVCKQAQISDKVCRVMEAGQNLVVAFGEKSAHVIDTNSLEVVDSFYYIPVGYIGAFFAEFKLILYSTAVGGKHWAADILHALEYGSSSRSLVARYLEGRIDWSVVCSSPSGRVFVVKEYRSLNDEDHLGVFGHREITSYRIR